jgi:hypothetical protein
VVAQVSLLRPGFLLTNGSRPEHPGLKSETWATHSIFVRTSEGESYVLHGRLDEHFHREVEYAVNLKVEDFCPVVVYSARRPLP